eukprot:TRINITY_DN6223_c0_g5_i1.p1 TRINITY_DN6223_c0_g5~~TRINITY_DN6223_c0_g5_i1.p1  ORF type:complete len:119 (+),score=2.75 TRINITY_DN6223_c0_g5_i1:81-437(+)
MPHFYAPSSMSLPSLPIKGTFAIFTYFSWFWCLLCIDSNFWLKAWLNSFVEDREIIVISWIICGDIRKRCDCDSAWDNKLSLIHISEPTRQAEISYAVFCLKKKKQISTFPIAAVLLL